MIRKIDGKGQPPLRHFKANNTPLEAPLYIADALAETFRKKSSSANSFRVIKPEKKRKNLISILLILSIIINSSPLKN